MALPNWYKTLGVPEDITKPDLERLREKERLEHHPDRHATASQTEKDRHASRLKTVLEGVSFLLTRDGKKLLDEQLRKERAAEAKAKAEREGEQNRPEAEEHSDADDLGTPPPIRTPPPFTWAYGAWPPPPFTPPSTPPHSSGPPRAGGNPTSPPEPERHESNPVLSALAGILQFIAGGIAAVVVGFGALTLYVAFAATLFLGALWIVVELLGYLFTGKFVS
jgi:hypothetical protein